MLPAQLLSRSSGATTPFALSQATTTRFVNAIQPATNVRFSALSAGASNGTSSIVAGGFQAQDQSEDPLMSRKDHNAVNPVAHVAGVNALSIEHFEGRLYVTYHCPIYGGNSLVSGGADASISMWDLEAPRENAGPKSRAQATIHRPIATVAKSSHTHQYGITKLSFYPFDSLAFISSSYDHALKIWDSTTLQPSASFKLQSVIYSHSISQIASHLLVACATQHPLIRLVDLRSGAATHTLAGHTGGSVLSVAWSPRDEHILASGGSDGTVRFWDTRRSAGCLGQLDMEDSTGIVGYDQRGLGARGRERGLAHTAPVNGVLWTDHGRFVVTTGHDEKIRVWDVHTGANTLANFGPTVRNRHVSTLLPLLVPKGVMTSGDEVLFFPNETEILMYEMFEGRPIKRLKVPRTASIPTESSSSGRNVKDRITSLTWRAHDIEMLSGHSNGEIQSWRPRTEIDAFVEEEEAKEEFGSEEEAERRKRKRQVLEDVEREVTAPKITWT